VRAPGNAGPRQHLVGGVTAPFGYGLSQRQISWMLVGAVVLVSALAYRYTLVSLLGSLGAATPLAYVALTPVLAVLLAAVRAIHPENGLELHDRYVDYIIGVPLILVALAIVAIVPIRLSQFFWLWRLDLISLPLFIAGAVALVLGVRTLWRFRLPIAFLALAWPVPYQIFVEGQLDAFTSTTVAAVHRILTVLPLATPVPSGDGSLFSIFHSGQSFLVSVASACSGVDGTLGFLLVGGAVLLAVSGSPWRKLVWLAVGMFVVWVLNVARILAIFATGHIWGPAIALDIVHPVAGLVLFNLGVLGMVLGLRLFGLRVDWPARRSRGLPRTTGPATTTSRRSVSVRTEVPAMILLVVIGAATTLADMRMPQYEVLAHDLGPPRLAPLSVVAEPVPGWAVVHTQEYPWVTEYFGRDSTWNRYVYFWRQQSTATDQFRALSPITLDVISTPDLGTFSTYGLIACYRFHHFRLLEDRPVDLGAGLVGHAVVYALPSHVDWAAVYWEWPVQQGSRVTYERVVLNLQIFDSTDLSSPQPTTNWLSNLQLSSAEWLEGTLQLPLNEDQRTVRTRDFMIGFAQQVVGSTATLAMRQSG
jgi:exosortase/archaeosortase family protein